MTKIISNTPHALHFMLGNEDTESTLTIPPSGEFARVEFKDLGLAQVLVEDNEVQLILGKRPTGITGVPAPAEDTLVVVSRTTKDALPDRNDLIVPDDLTLDDAGRDTVQAWCQDAARAAGYQPDSSSTGGQDR